MKDFIYRLTSRKFLLTVGGFAAVLLFPEYTDDIIKLVGFYLGAEGAADAVRAYTGKNPLTPNFAPHAKPKARDESFFMHEDEDEPDKSQAPVPGA